MLITGGVSQQRRRKNALVGLEISLRTSQKRLGEIKDLMDDQENNPLSYKADTYKRLIQEGAWLNDKQIPRIKKEIATLKSRI